jgi:DNA-binding NtrC family response regulator
LVILYIVHEQDTEEQGDSSAQDTARQPTAHVQVITGALLGSRQEIPTTGIMIGRAGRSEPAQPGVLLLPDPTISRHHARIHRSATGWQLADQNSRNGGFVNGTALAPSRSADLTDRAVIRLGDSLLVFRATPAPVARNDEVDVECFPGRSPEAISVRRRLAQLTRNEGSVLILGETGTGKERVAHALRIPSRPFIPQNCAELTRELSRSELFGHLRGAFSGAANSKPGLVEIAHGGVLFLDEVGELELGVQADLLRFLEDGWYRPIGATELRHSSARVVAATNVDLEQAVRGGTFRRDLLARLRASNGPIELPALRDRREDILDWTKRWLREASVPAEREFWTVGAAECLLLYAWPDNLRELRGVTLAASTLDHDVRTDELPEAIRTHRRALRAGPGPDRREAAVSAATREPTSTDIAAALAAAGGRMRSAAQQLGLDRRKLYRLCDKHGIDVSKYRPSPGSNDPGPVNE